jgi:hypothetical protein
MIAKPALRAYVRRKASFAWAAAAASAAGLAIADISRDDGVEHHQGNPKLVSQ